MSDAIDMLNPVVRRAEVAIENPERVLKPDADGRGGQGYEHVPDRRPRDAAPAEDDAAVAGNGGRRQTTPICDDLILSESARRLLEEGETPPHEEPTATPKHDKHFQATA
jgi:hypothetical protein